MRTLAILLLLVCTGPATAAEADPPDIADVPSQDLRAGENERMRYFLIGPNASPVPADGYRLLVVLPGGNGSADFQPFVRRIWKHALGPDFIVAQPVAVKWMPDQQVVWPTKSDPKVPGQQFTTEQFVRGVIDDVKSRHRIDARRVILLAWSSGGPAAYQLSLEKDTPVTGSFIAMSVFKPGDLPPLTQAQGRPYYLLHSPDDRTCPFAMARQAQSRLREAGALVEMKTYRGGHGWNLPVWPAIREGVHWLVLHPPVAASHPAQIPATATSGPAR